MKDEPGPIRGDGGTSEPFGVVLDSAEGEAVSKAAVDHCVDRKEVSDGSSEEITLYEREKRRETEAERQREREEGEGREGKGNERERQRNTETETEIGRASCRERV